MKQILLVAALVAMPNAFAHELDNEQTTASTKLQFAKSQQPPRSTIIRVSKSNPAEVAFLPLDKELAKGEKVTNANFAQVAINTEIFDKKFNSTNELDATSSTPSWRWGYNGGSYYNGYGHGAGWGAAYVRGPRGGSAVVVGGGRYNYGYNHGRGRYAYDNYDYNNGYYGYDYDASVTITTGCYDYSYGCGTTGYYPVYRAANRYYRPQPYYSYDDADYYYDCYNYGYGY